MQLQALVNNSSHLYERVTRAMRPVLMLLVRINIGLVFFRSGVVKIEDFSGTVFLFANEYHVPVLPPLLAAVMATACELGCSTLLMVGLASRLAALPLLVMTGVIELTYDSGNPEHLFWALSLLTIVVYGAECLSIDGFIIARIRQQPLCIFKWARSGD